MGSVSSKNLQDVTVAEVQVHVAGMGKDYQKYTQSIADKRVNGGVLYRIKEEEKFIRMLETDFGIESIALTNALVEEWEKARAKQAKRQKIMDEKGQTTVKLTNTDLFFAPSEVPKPQHDEKKKLIPFIGVAWLEKPLSFCLTRKKGMIRMIGHSRLPWFAVAAVARHAP